MKSSFTYTKLGPKLSLSSPLTSHVNVDYLMTLSHRQRLLGIYKRLYKLRFLIGNSVREETNYHSLLRRKFSNTDFVYRRERFIGCSSQLSEREMAKRLANTYAFIFNATCELEGHHQIAEIYFYEELKQLSKRRVESNVLRTMLDMDEQMPAQIKHDSSLAWVDHAQNLSETDVELLSNKDVNKLMGSKILNWIGFLQYERTLMHMNESLELCL